VDDDPKSRLEFRLRGCQADFFSVAGAVKMPESHTALWSKLTERCNRKARRLINQVRHQSSSMPIAPALVSPAVELEASFQ
jgi:hypothetical protein